MAFKITLGELPRQSFFGFFGGGNAGRRAGVEADPYGNLTGWVYFALDKVAQRVASVEPQLYQLKSGGEVDEIDDHELLSVLYRANPQQTKHDLFYLLVMYLRIWGTAPVYVETNGKRVVNLWPLRPDLVRVNQDKKGNIVNYEYRVAGIDNPEKFKPEEIIYIRKPSPANPMTGFSVLFASALDINADFAAVLWNTYVMENSAEPGGVLSTEEELTDEQFARVKDQWQARYSGPTNAGRTAVLEKGLKFEKISQTPAELDFINGRKFNKETILTQLGLPPSLIDPVSNRANAETAERFFSKETVEPIARLIFDQLNEFFVPKFGDNLWLDFKTMVGEDEEQLRLEHQAGLNNWLTINEIREARNLAPLDGGDVLYMPFTVAPMVGAGASGEIVEPADPNAAPKSGPVVAIKEFKVREANGFMTSKKYGIKKAILARTYRKRRVINYVAEKVMDKLTEISNTSKNKVKVKLALKGDVPRFNDEELAKDLHPSIVAERKNYLKKLATREKAFKRVLLKFFKAQEKEVLAKLEAAGSPKAFGFEIKAWVDRVIFDRKKAIAALIALTKGQYEDNVEEGSEDIANLLGLTPSDIVANAATVQFLLDKPIKMAESVNDTTIEALRKTLAEGVENGESIGEIGNRVSVVMDMAKGFRTETISRTEVGSALNFGRNGEMSAQGIEKKQWVAIFSNTRDDHAEAHGQVVGQNEKFDVGGEELEYPQDPEGSAGNVINCQCSVVPVVERD